MGEDKNPLETKLFVRVGLAGLALSFVGIGLFVLVWNVLGQAGVADFPRLFASICIPPAGIACVMGVYLLIFRPYNSSS